MTGAVVAKSPGRWQRLTCALALIALLLPPAPARAAIEEYRLVAVGVDNSSDSAEAKALDYAKKRAIFLAVRKLGLQNPGAVAEKLVAGGVDDLIRGATILKTQRRDTTTFADVTVSIIGENLRRRLKLPPESETSTAVTSAVPLRNILVIPVLRHDGHGYVWNRENTLRPVVSELLREMALRGVVLPAGDLEDLRLLDYENAASVKGDELAPMFKRYGVEEVILAVATLGAKEEKPSILLRRIHPGDVALETLALPPAEEQDPPADDATRFHDQLESAGRAIVIAARQIASSSASYQREALNKANKVEVTLTYAVPKELAQMSATIRAVPGVMQLSLPTIALNEVAGTIYTTHAIAELKTELAKQGIVVRETPSGWDLSLR